MEVYTLLLCPNAACNNAKDSIRIKMAEYRFDSYYDYETLFTVLRTYETRWERQRFTFKTKTGRIYVFSIE